MKKKTIYFLILATFLLVFAASCSQKQEESVNTKEATPEIQASTTPTIVLETTPTATPTPKKAEDFEGCSTMDLGTSVKVNNMNYFNGPELEVSDTTYDGSSWLINGEGVRAVITNSETIDGLTHFSINDTKLSVTEGAIVYIYMYADSSEGIPTYHLGYSPTSNQFLSFYTPFLPPYITVYVDPDSTVSLPKGEDGASYYLGNWCVVQDGESPYLFAGSMENAIPRSECVTYKLPNGDNEYNGDEYGWGLNKYGEIVCPQMWVEETETE